MRYGQTNRIVVKVDSRETLDIPPFGYVVDYLTYGGIYRPVYLEVKEKIHFRDVFVMPDDRKHLEVKLEAEGARGLPDPGPCAGRGRRDLRPAGGAGLPGSFPHACAPGRALGYGASPALHAAPGAPEIRECHGYRGSPLWLPEDRDEAGRMPG